MRRHYVVRVTSPRIVLIGWPDHVTHRGTMGSDTLVRAPWAHKCESQNVLQRQRCMLGWLDGSHHEVWALALSRRRRRRRRRAVFSQLHVFFLQREVRALDSRSYFGEQQGGICATKTTAPTGLCKIPTENSSFDHCCSCCDFKGFPHLVLNCMAV